MLSRLTLPKQVAASLQANSEWALRSFLRLVVFRPSVIPLSRVEPCLIDILRTGS